MDIRLPEISIMISTEFAGYIDTLEARKGIKKTVLLRII